MKRYVEDSRERKVDRVIGSTVPAVDKQVVTVVLSN